MIQKKYYLILLVVTLGTGFVLNDVMRGEEIPIFFPYLILTTLVMLFINWKTVFARFQNKALVALSLIGLVVMLISMQGGT